jgi:hypothetical protein
MKYSSEIFKILIEKYPHLDPRTGNFLTGYFEISKNVRQKMVEKEKVQYLDQKKALPQLSKVGLLGLTEKARIDYLCLELRFIILQTAMSIASAHYFLPNTCDFRKTNQLTYDDLMYWYHIDYGIRLISSCWDRLSHYISLAFELAIDRIDFQNVIREIPKRHPTIVHNENFKQLKYIRDVKFKEVEDKYSRGRRNIADHVLSSFTQIFCLRLEKWDPSYPDQIKELVSKVHDELEFLETHFDIFQDSMNRSFELVQEYSQEGQSCQ